MSETQETQIWSNIIIRVPAVSGQEPKVINVTFGSGTEFRINGQVVSEFEGTKAVLTALKDEDNIQKYVN